MNSINKTFTSPMCYRILLLIQS